MRSSSCWAVILMSPTWRTTRLGSSVAVAGAMTGSGTVTPSAGLVCWAAKVMEKAISTEKNFIETMIIGGVLRNDPGIEKRDAEVVEVAGVAGDEGEVVMEGGRGD